MEESVRFRWLGVAGIELSTEQEVLAIDPIFSRPPFREVWFGRIFPDRQLVAARLPRCSYVLVSHFHWDHLVDVSEVVLNTGATALGPPSSCRLLALLGVPEDRIQEIRADDRLELGGFEVQVFRARHASAFQRPIVKGSLPLTLHPLPEARDPQMDVAFSFLVEAEGHRLLDWHGATPDSATPADVLLVDSGKRPLFYQELLAEVRPKVVIPTHWDNPFRPLSGSPLTAAAPPAWALPPTQRINLTQFRRTIRRISPTTRVFVPEILRQYDLPHLL
ncbi:MAG: MBL fold metallo-hydrolase [Sphingomonadaceae bacterium]